MVLAWREACCASGVLHAATRSLGEGRELLEGRDRTQRRGGIAPGWPAEGPSACGSGGSFVSPFSRVRPQSRRVRVPCS